MPGRSSAGEITGAAWERMSFAGGSSKRLQGLALGLKHHIQPIVVRDPAACNQLRACLASGTLRGDYMPVPGPSKASFTVTGAAALASAATTT